MNDAIQAATRRFPLLGRPRPACPALPQRIQEVTDAVTAAEQKGEQGFADAAHALNKAALIASDCGLPYLAEQLCWQHIHVYRHLGRPLTIVEARYLLEPVLNLARLHIRADQGNAAIQLLEAMYDAVTRRQNLTVGDYLLPTAELTGDPLERRQLREWVWLQLIGEGVRALALAGRWTAAAEHARAHKGIGIHLMEGRQAAIIAAILNDDLPQARNLLGESALTQPWELEVLSCFNLMCARPGVLSSERQLDVALAGYRARGPVSGYASYRARLGLTLVTLAYPTRPDTAAILLREVAEETIAAADGYAARDLLSFRGPVDGITPAQRTRLTNINAESRLGLRTLPDLALQQLTSSTLAAETALRTALVTCRNAVTGPSAGHH
ncbi:hypothetical protein [Couchioplanes azureus]|uniref:hypothetical protein n=1 Tax=Couchioplanes caeruleus TaxID=56438 RepID=UPI0016712830|nr:hypothetical protein [Couchioplanes caeruleus]GGQ42944.1 hypothetical protein GCM10010166_08950 [Couchioplanes caeruleus subsp. azureus]